MYGLYGFKKKNCTDFFRKFYGFLLKMYGFLYGFVQKSFGHPENWKKKKKTSLKLRQI